MPVEVIKSLEEFNLKINSGKVVYIDFYADWCGPCRTISPAFEKISDTDEAASAEFYKVNIDDVPDVAQEVKIRALPTFIAFKNGDRLDELVGADRGQLQTLVATHIQA